MKRRAMTFSLLLPLLGGIANATQAKVPSGESDLRDFVIGVPVSQLSEEGYKDLVCKGDPNKHLTRWTQFRECPVGEHGLHAISFAYDEAKNPLARISEEGQGTKVAGQPVVPSLLIDEDGRLAGISIISDPHAKLFERRRAYLFGNQAKARYGEEGWSCEEGKPSDTEEPIGPSFVKEHCEKTTPTRKFILDRSLFRNTNLPLRSFVSETRLTILAPNVN